MSVGIQLKNAPGLYVSVSKEDANYVRSLEPRLWWDGRKFAIVGRGHTRIARAIRGLAKGNCDSVRLRDGNPFNLVRSNLKVFRDTNTMT